ncbi:MAG: hypothetical protein ABIH39_05670 [Candidatus Margulisiibacteriota bacterium]
MVNKRIMFVVLILLVMFVAGCGKINVFEGIAGGTESTSSDANENANRMVDNGDYNAAITVTTGVISSNTSTADEQREAYAIRGEATLGQSGVNAGAMISTLTNTANADVQGNLNLLNTIVASTTIAQITGAADDLLRALTANLTLKTSVASVSEINIDNLSDRQLLAGFACALAAAKLIVEGFDENGDKTLTAAADFNNGDTTNRSADWLSCTSTSGYHASFYMIKAAEFLGAAIANEDFTVEDIVSNVRDSINSIDALANSNTLTNAYLVQYLL